MVENNKYCAICVNDMHLVVMLMPYIEKELEKGAEIVTIFEKSLENEIELLSSKVNLGKSRKNRIKKLNWSENKLTENEISELKNKIVLVKGNKGYIEKMNDFLGNNGNTIINCFDLNIFEKEARAILGEHHSIINTSGVRKIPESFHLNWPKNIILT